MSNELIKEEARCSTTTDRLTDREIKFVDGNNLIKTSNFQIL